jgi:GABA permease
MTWAPLPKSMILVLIAEEICGECLARELTDRGDGPADTSVVLIAPALVHSRTEVWADAIDADIAEAQRKVDVSVDLLRRQGYTVMGKVGDSDPVRATRDALAEFPAERVIVATHPADRMQEPERNLIDRLTRSAGIAVTRVVMTSDGDYPLTRSWEGIRPGTYAKERSPGRRQTRGRHRTSMTQQQKE